MHWLLSSFLSWLEVILFPKVVFKWIYILVKTLPRDITYFLTNFKIYLWVSRRQKKKFTVSKLFSEQVNRNPKRVAYYFEDETWTFEKVEQFSNKLANYFEQEGYKKGDVIALMLDNCMEYPSIWLGLSKTGIVTALINTNLVKDSLLNSIRTANCRAIIFGTNHFNAVREILANAQLKKLYHYRSTLGVEHEKLMGSVDLAQELTTMSDQYEQPKNLSTEDPFLYIYTSGTTGLPKAAIVTHLKFLYIGKWFHEYGKYSQNDIIYGPLPLYHSAGGVGVISQVLIAGAAAVIRKKFSATNFLKDCAKYKVTGCFYIGELCRYLLATPEDRSEKYSIKTFLGTGMKPQIWKQVAERFGVQHVIEIYGATESNTFLINTDGTVGAVGFIPRYLKWVTGTTTVKFNESTGEPIRNKDGFCLECDVKEQGILISKIKSSQVTFDGYSDKQATNKKLLRNVFRKGDVYYNTGDMLEYDEFGYYYFKDRTGDTFRWKGENVSTFEIEAIISNIISVTDVTVYGVEVPYTDGRAGMAAIVCKNGQLGIDALGHSFKLNLPSYAIPIFIRIMDSVPMTSTMKFQKVDLREEGFDINKIKDAIYFYHSKFVKYVPLTMELFEKIKNGELRI